ncbi:MAG: UDP-N-acetylmuramate--L-alanine ligase [Saprospiraceae bacterium]|nr:UDP-N-acetylmuramate--L-alanine ligase [Saprospiraceae bacterium]
MNIQEVQRIYFIGIGGIGMSALARYFHQRGVLVSGYDKTETHLTRQLAAEGIDVTYLAKVETIPNEVDLAVYTPAVPADHPAFAHFRTTSVPLMKRAEILGWISRNATCIAVAGTHGKTTTTTIIAHMLRTAGVDCSAFLGGISGNYGTNYLLGLDDWMVVEADEYDRSFLHLHPTILIVNALDPDHLDIYSDEKDMLQTYYQLLKQVRPEGHILLREDLGIPEEVLAEVTARIHRFGQGAVDFKLAEVAQVDEQIRFDLETEVETFRQIAFTLPGIHNAYNAAAAFATGVIMGLDTPRLYVALSTFKGVHRRFDIHVDTETVAYVDDYAHHPVELEGLEQAVRSRFPGRKVTVVFQPHLFSRTRDFADAFAKALDRFDIPVITEIYPARELPIPGVNVEMILDRMVNPEKKYIPREALLAYLNAQKPDVLVTAGAGDIDRLIPNIIELLNPSES